MNAVTGPKHDYLVADIKLVDWGRKEIVITEAEIPGLMAIREEFAASQPLKGTHIVGSLHMTIRTAVLTGTSKTLGADVCWVSYNILSMRGHAAAAITATGTSVFAFRGESLQEYWDFAHHVFEWADGGTPNMILDDGGDAALLPHLGAEAEKDASVLVNPDSEEETFLFTATKEELAKDATFYNRSLDTIKGVTEEITAGMRRLYQMAQRGEPHFSTTGVNDSVTKSKFDNLHSYRRSLADGTKCATDVMIAGKVVIVVDYGDVGKGLAQALCALSAQVWVTEIGPICALQAVMEDYRVATMDYAAEYNGIFMTCTDNYHVIMHDHAAKMKDRVIVCNIGYFDNETDIASVEKYQWGEIKPQVDHMVFPDGKKIIILAKGRLVNPGYTTDYPSYVMSSSFVNQTIVQIGLWTEAVKGSNKYPVGVYVLSKHPDEKIAHLQLKKLSVQLIELTDQQAAYVGISEEGPYRVDYYRY